MLGTYKVVSAACTSFHVLIMLQIDGIWHTGMVLDGREYFFGQGIQHTPAGASPFGKPLHIIELGYASFKCRGFILPWYQMAESLTSSSAHGYCSQHVAKPSSCLLSVSW